MNRRITPAIVLGALALIIFAALAAVPSVSSQSDSDGETVQVIARIHQSGRIEFGLRTSEGDQLPRSRLFPTGVTHENWLRSTPIELPDGTSVRIIARRAGETRVEFGVRIDDPRQEFFPRRRFFPRSTRVGRWRVSTPVTLPAPAPEPPAAEDQTQSEPTTQTPPIETPADETPAVETPVTQTPTVETISGGPRDGLIVEGNIVGDPDAPVLIVEYGDPF